jgi:hypothetical protein
LRAAAERVIVGRQRSPEGDEMFWTSLAVKSLILLFGVAATVLLVPIVAHGSQEGALALSSFTIQSPGIGESGPVTISGTQNANTVTALNVKAFGKEFNLAPKQLQELKGLGANGVQLSYERGYKELGGRTLYLQLSFGFISEKRSAKVVVVSERGDVTVMDVRTK